jgi:DNA polymerase-3 subunit epsilon
MQLLDRPLASAEFLAVDTETNGLAGELCELTEVGAVLVGGGELHESFDSLVRVERPLRRSIQHFTGISQGMVDGAPAPAEVLGELAQLLRGRVLVAHNARFDTRVLAQAFERAQLEWPDPPTLCTVTLGRRFAPLARQRKLVALADALGIEVEEVHRALPDALTCARIFCALFPRLCANAPSVGDAVELLRARRRGRRTERGERIPSRRAYEHARTGASERIPEPLPARWDARGTELGEHAPAESRARRPRSPGSRTRIPPSERPDLSTLPDDPGVYIFRDDRGRPLYIGKSVSLRSRARSHFCAPAGWTEQAEVVDYRPTNSELGALVLENRLIKQHRPAGNVKLKRTDAYVYLRCRLDITYPVLEVAAAPAPGRAVNVGPLRGKALAAELADQLTSLYRLRHCGRTLKLREHPSAYGQMGRCVSPCLGDLDPNAYRRQLDAALSFFDGADGRERLLAEIDARIQAAAQEQRYERAAALLRRRGRVAWLLEKLEGVLRAVHTAPRLVVARHPTKERYDAFWIVQGRLADWGPLPGASKLVERTDAALKRAAGGVGATGAASAAGLASAAGAASATGAARTVVPADEVDELRIVAAWIADHEPPTLALDPAPQPEDLQAFASGAAAQPEPSAV